jgi:hypothetical protein
MGKKNFRTGLLSCHSDVKLIKSNEFLAEFLKQELN